MGKLKVEKDVGGIEGLCIITPTIYEDSRGTFMETYNAKDMETNGLNMVFVQDNQSCSKRGVLRGMHLQTKYAQGKLVRVVKGSVFDVAVDLRKGSKTFGKWYGIELNEENKKQFYLPEGLAHGFLVTSDIAEFCYKVTNYYHPEYEQGFAWNDPDLQIVWPGISGCYRGSAAPEGYQANDCELILAERDQKLKPLYSSSLKDGV